MKRWIRKLSLYTGLTATVALNGTALAIYTMGGFDTTHSKYETSLKNKPVGENDSTYLAKKAKQVFHTGAGLAAENAILIINAPDNPSDKTTYGSAAVIGKNIFDSRKEAVYQKIAKLPNTVFFAYGSNDHDDKIDSNRVNDLIKIVSDSKAKNISVIFSGHGNMYGINMENKSFDEPFYIKDGDTIYNKNPFLSYEKIYTMLEDNFKGKEKDLNLLLFPCSTGAFVMAAEDLMNDPGTPPIDFQVYCAAGVAESSSPMDALKGLSKIMDRSLEKGRLIPMEEMSILLAAEASNQPNHFYSPEYARYQSNHDPVYYSFYGPNQIYNFYEYESRMQKILFSSEYKNALLEKGSIALSIKQPSSYVSHSLMFLMNDEKEDNRKRMSAVELLGETFKVKNRILETADHVNTKPEEREKMKDQYESYCEKLALDPKNRTFFPDPSGYIQIKSNEDLFDTTSSILKKFMPEKRTKLMTVMLNNFAPVELQRAALNLDLK